MALVPALYCTTCLCGAATLQVDHSQKHQTTPLHILAFGDSLTAGYGLPQGHSFAHKLEQTLKAAGHNVRVTNAGISGDTTAAGSSRLAWSLSDTPDLVILELGANDALRGIAPEIVQKNLQKMILQCLETGSAVLLCGITAPINFGPVYKKDFDRIFPELAQKINIPLYPFFLEGVLNNPALTLDDGLHPNVQGIEIIVNNILPLVQRILQLP